MDNPNDFIHIDELFKKLKDAEEPEVAGSWLRMQELLDSEMPVGAPAAGNAFRRYLLPLAALLVIGTGVAYYNHNKGNSMATDMEKPSVASGSHITPNTNIPSGSQNLHDTKGPITPGQHANNQASSTGHSDNNNNNTTPNVLAPVYASSNTVTKHGHHGTSHHSNRPANGGSKAVVVASNNHNNPAAKSGIHSDAAGKGAGQHNTNNNAVVASGNSTNNPLNNNKAGNTILTKNNTAATTTSVATTEGNTAGKPKGQTTALPTEEQNVVEQIYPGSTNSNTVAGNGAGTAGKHGSKSGKEASSNNNMKVVASNWNNHKIVKDLNDNYFKEVRDTFKKIDMLEHTVASNTTGKKVYTTQIDTLAITRVERIKFQPLVPMEMAALRMAKIIPQATLAAKIPMVKEKQYTVTNEMVNLVPLANYKVASRKVDPSRFNQLIGNTTQGISNYFDGTNKFYAAILLGGNGFAGNPSAFGMQFGIAGLYQISERLTLGVEFKFANHYFSNYTINDKTVNFNNISSEQVSGVEWLFKGTQTTVTSAYKINSIASLDFPVTLNYSLGRIGIFGGLNMAYALPVKWNKTLSTDVQDVSEVKSQTTSPFVNASNTMNEKTDMASRFGMGYVAGVSYDINRKVSLDARMTQNLWTSYNGSAEAVNRLFKVPTMQFSISYFFGRKERVVYIMDKR